MIALTENVEFPEDIETFQLPKSIEVYEIDGPFFFGLASKLDELDSSEHHKVKVRIIRMRKVPFMDSTGLNNLRNLLKRSRKEKIEIVLSGVNENVKNYLESSGFAMEIGRENILPHISLAVERALYLDSIIKDNSKSIRRV